MANKSKAKETAAKAKETVISAVAAAKETAKETVKEPVAKVKETAKETAAKVKETTAKAKETTAKAKETVAKTAKKTSKESCFIEFDGKQVSVADVTENAKKHWQASNSGVISDIKVYVNTKESKAYYVVNNEDHGDFDI